MDRSHESLTAIINYEEEILSFNAFGVFIILWDLQKKKIFEV